MPKKKTVAAKHSSRRISSYFIKENVQVEKQESVTEHVDPITDTLLKTFKLSSFRPGQEEIIRYIVSGKDALILMPTGGGKSLCYQLPGVVSKGVTIVISPLIALIQNQISALQNLNIPAASLNSCISASEKKSILFDLESSEPKLKLVYTTPETLSTPTFRVILKNLIQEGNLSRIVIDEAHCISEWGHDFRNDYCKISFWKTEFPDLQMIALTATATPSVKQDIIKQLHLSHSVKIFTSSFNRHNLHYEVRFKNVDTNDPYENILDFLQESFNNNQDECKSFSGIIYCNTRNTCDEIAEMLKKDGINAYAYHAGLTPKTRKLILDAWSGVNISTSSSVNTEKNQDKKSKKPIVEIPQVIDIVVATISFGMGIDKSNVRFVIHYDMPKSLESYYQESGRAGRDGLVSRCILYYSRQDRDRLAFLLNQEAQDNPRIVTSFNQMIQYCENSITCRHIFIMKYFGECIPTPIDYSIVCPFKRCDVCNNQKKLIKDKNASLRNTFQGKSFRSSNHHLQDKNDYLRDGTMISQAKKRTLPAELDYGMHSGTHASHEMGGFQSAKQFKSQSSCTTTVQDHRFNLFGKSNSSTTKNVNESTETRYPLLAIPYHSVSGLSGKKRDETFIKFKDWIAKHVPFTHSFWRTVTESKRESALESISIQLEGKCYSESKILAIYQNSIVSRLREIKSGNLNLLNSFLNDYVFE